MQLIDRVFCTEIKERSVLGNRPQSFMSLLALTLPFMLLVITLGTTQERLEEKKMYNTSTGIVWHLAELRLLRVSSSNEATAPVPRPERSKHTSQVSGFKHL